MVMGRPTKLTQPATYPGPDGTTTGTVADAIIDTVRRLGISPSLAGRRAGVSAEVTWKWIREGKKHIQRREDGRALIASEHRLCDFVTRLDAAHSEYLAGQLDLMQQLADGNVTVAHITEEVDPNDLVAGPDGQLRPRVIKRTVKQSRTLPDINAVKWNLERKGKTEGFAPSLEVTGADGGPVEVVSRDDRVASLLAEADAFLHGAESARQVETSGPPPAAG